jgi:NMD protein affecting ribosome stability and mRNA decay
MTTTGKYSRSTTKKSIDTEKDPYLRDAGPPKGAVCTRCGAVYSNKRWALGTPPTPAAVEKAPRVTCPACRKIKDGYVGGFVTLRGEFLEEHSEEILNMVRNKEKRAMNNNPLDRIISIKRTRGDLEITTTTDKLAQRIGQMLGKAYNGSVEYKWSDDIKMTRVVWTRQL